MAAPLLSVIWSAHPTGGGLPTFISADRPQCNRQTAHGGIGRSPMPKRRLLAIERSEAWRTYDQLWADERVVWADEPGELDAVWRAISARDDKSHKLWTDDYLPACLPSPKPVQPR